MRSTYESWLRRRGWLVLLLGGLAVAGWAVSATQPAAAQPDAPERPDAAEPVDAAGAPDPEAAPTEGEVPVDGDVPPEVDRAVVISDPDALLYMTKCIGCHTIGGGALTGPDLAPTLGWPRENLVAGIVRMEDKVGPLPADEVDRLTEFLQSGNALDRLDAERQRIALAEAATLEPGSTRIGEALFHGRRALENHGLSCAACHIADGRGGNFAPDLTGIFDKLGEPSLQSACEGANFPVMREAYADHPVTKQEARHLVAYFQGFSGKEQAGSSGSPLPLLVQLFGVAGCVGVFGLVGLIHIRKRPSVRRSMVRNSHKGETQ